MPSYNTYQQAQRIGGKKVFSLWQSETVVPGSGRASASQQFECYEPGFSIGGLFLGNPGVFEIDVQTAAIDSDPEYQTVGVISSCDPVNFSFSFIAPNVKAVYVRLLMRTLTNAVQVIGRGVV